MAAITKAGIITKPNAAGAPAVVPKLVEWLEARGIDAAYDHETAAYAGRSDGIARSSVADGCDLLIVLGGDGTLLSAARVLAGRPIPLFAVNLGGLGFLTAITVDELFPELEKAVSGDVRIVRRSMLQCEVRRSGERCADYDALNDAVLTKAALARMIDLDVFVDGNFVCAYKADGLIVSTPTGSTAYSLSAGGPIIFPAVNAVCLTPICPHMLTNRPVILPGESVIEIVVRSEGGSAYLTIDGQVGAPLQEDDRIVCMRSPDSLHLIRPPKLLFFDVLREKLRWGER